MKTIIGNRGKQFTKKELISCLVETICLGQCYFAASRNDYWNKEKTVLKETAHSCQCTTDFLASVKHFFLHFSEIPASFFSVQWKSIFQGNPYFQLGENNFRVGNGFYKQKKAVNKRILFPIDRNPDSTSQNEEFVKKIRFDYAEKLLSSAEMSKKLVKNGFKYKKRGYSIKMASP